ncbi:MAG TPA: SAM-dependent chlorinase/fluorinase [Actinomycetota bacterium]|nr:SAM-dependent chlorinase/fluorinase [Actinomycetota bacterium]
MRPLVFLSDYGLDDEFVGVCHAVVARIAPGAAVIDLTHGIPPHDVLRGALVLAEASRHAPENAVYLAVVDPGVGTERRGVALEAGMSLLVGPDNGLLWPAAEALGGVRAAVEIPLPPGASATFHGRDVFAPAAARLSGGEGLTDVGAAVDPSTLARLEPPSPEVRSGMLRCAVLAVDRFGNVQLAARVEHLERAELDRAPQVELRSGLRAAPVRRARTFAEIPEGEHAILVDSAGWLAVVRNRASAAEALRLAPGDDVVLAAPGFG